MDAAEGRYGSVWLFFAPVRTGHSTHLHPRRLTASPPPLLPILLSPAHASSLGLPTLDMASLKAYAYGLVLLLAVYWAHQGWKTLVAKGRHAAFRRSVSAPVYFVSSAAPQRYPPAFPSKSLTSAS